METKKSGHILIGGTGRSGTTLLVQILTYLKLDTGYTLQESLKNIDPVSRGGLERRLTDPYLPKIIKSPFLCNDIRSALESNFPIDMAIIPVRDIREAADSRRGISRYAQSIGVNPTSYRGGLWDTNDPTKQEEVLAINFFKFLQPLVEFDIPIVFLAFPRFVNDVEYFYNKLIDIFDINKVSFESVNEAFLHLVKSEAIGNSKSLNRQ